LNSENQRQKLSQNKCAVLIQRHGFLACEFSHIKFFFFTINQVYNGKTEEYSLQAENVYPLDGSGRPTRISPVPGLGAAQNWRSCTVSGSRARHDPSIGRAAKVGRELEIVSDHERQDASITPGGASDRD
jgi:hypothetical protein